VVFLLIFFTHAHHLEIPTLSLHDALPISVGTAQRPERDARLVDVLEDAGKPERQVEGVRLVEQRDRVRLPPRDRAARPVEPLQPDRKSTRLNSSHVSISYAVFCLKKKKKI